MHFSNIEKNMVFNLDNSIVGSEVKNEMLKTNDGNFKAAAYVKKGKNHETCDDAALLVVNEKFALIGVFDGVSGGKFACEASERALRAVKFFITQNFDDSVDERIVERAIEEANFAIDNGATTASIALVFPDGRYFFANVGDSHIYKRDKHEKISRITVDEKQANGSGFTVYINSRYLLPHSLGGIIGIIDVGHGKLEKGEFLFAMSDGISDNLVIEVDGGVIKEVSGARDLEIIIGANDEPAEITDAISKEIKERMQDSEKSNNGEMLVPKEDDASLVVLKY